LVAFSFLQFTFFLSFGFFEKIVIVSGLSIFVGDEYYYHITAELTKIKGGALEGNVVPIIHEGQGVTIQAALEEIRIKCGKQLHLGHCELILVSKDIAEREMLSLTESLMSIACFSPLSTVAISREETARSHFINEESDEDDDIEEKVTRELLKGMMSRKPLYRLRRDLHEESSVLVPVVPDGLALLERGNFVRIFDRQDSLYLQIILNEFENAKMTFSDSENTVNVTNPDITIKFTHSKSRIKDGNLHVTLSGESWQASDEFIPILKQQIKEKLREFYPEGKITIELTLRNNGLGN